MAIGNMEAKVENSLTGLRVVLPFLYWGSSTKQWNPKNYLSYYFLSILLWIVLPSLIEGKLIHSMQWLS